MQPTDMQLYNQVKRRVYRAIPQHSAYRSGHLVQTYKRAFGRKYGPRKSPYLGRRKSQTGLSRWFQEEWRNQRGEVGYRYRSDVYRPTRVVSRKTPRTFRELGSRRIASARRRKARSGRVRLF